MPASPGSGTAPGVSGAMIKTTVLPAVRDATQRVSNLTPEKQSQLTDRFFESAI